MNQYEHWRRMVEKNKKLYPPGTRIELAHMEDPYSPVPDGMRGTVKFVDDSGQIHMNWDNGRTLPLNSDEDSFRTLTAEEVAAEQAETEGQSEEPDEDEAQVMSM